MSTSLNASIRRTSWLLQSVQIRQTARRAFDLTHLGTGSAERLCSALVLGAAFFFPALLLAHFAGLERAYVVGIPVAALVTVMVTSAALVLWGADDKLGAEASELKKQLSNLREAAAQEQAAEAEERAARAARDAVGRKAEAHRRTAEYAARPVPTTKRCPYCREEIMIQAVKCKHCDEFLDEYLRAVRRVRPPQRWNPGVAAVLSFFWPGVGQMYKGQVVNGFALMMLVTLGYFFCLIPGFFLHVLCVFDAASGRE